MLFTPNEYVVLLMAMAAAACYFVGVAVYTWIKKK